ncbi:MAG: UPF0149 family protein [Gammaproteobacteria bacterium]|nr:UPF0149 family protein [Gammaproteobacteria bacterium]MBU1653509.1 UPF0149 family protein [Gammaproteobacteria bacterium]MBU1961857.1 UPF0149 family protein [Gammaproteobacteria bacterium]
MTDKTRLLLELGAPKASDQAWPSYLQYGFTPADVPALITMATDRELHEAADSSAEVWAPLHAWRTLGQLASAEAAEPLVEFLPVLAEDDWAIDEMPSVMGMIGAPALEPLAAALNDPARQDKVRGVAVDGLKAVAEHEPSVRDRVVGVLTAFIATPTQGNASLNAMVAGALADLGATESIEAIRGLYARGLADLMFAGDIEDIEIEMGLRQQRATPKPSLNKRLGLAEPQRPDGDDIFELVEYYLTRYGSDESLLNVSGLDGYFAAIACSPKLIPPSVWFPAIWNEEGMVPHWKGKDDGEEFMLAVGILYNDVVDQLAGKEYEALFLEQDDGGERVLVVDFWCDGFVRGVELWPELSAEDGLELDAALDLFYRFLNEDVPTDPHELAEVQDLIDPTVDDLYDYFASHRITGHQTFIREEPKVGRNEPCPCGSGKKYKKCCMPQ